MRFDFDSESRTWSLEGAAGKEYPLVTFVDESFTKVNIGNGETMMVENSQQGLYALRQTVDARSNLYAAR